MLESGQNNEGDSMQIPPKALNNRRIRRIKGSFSWIDHRFINNGFIQELSTGEILLYLFLVTVGNRHGVSFYGDDSILRLLKISRSCLHHARDSLIARSLIGYQEGIYQVLELPECGKERKNESARGGVYRIGDVLTKGGLPL